MKNLIPVFFTESGFVEGKVSHFSNTWLETFWYFLYKNPAEKSRGVVVFKKWTYGDNIYHFQCQKPLLFRSRFPLDVNFIEK